MYDAQLLWVKNTTGSDYSLYSPWFARHGDNARFTGEIIALNGSPELKIEVHDRDEDTSGVGTLLGGNITLTTATRTTQEWTGLRAFVRFKYTITNGGGTNEWLLFRMLHPVWFSDVKV